MSPPRVLPAVAALLLALAARDVARAGAVTHARNPFVLGSRALETPSFTPGTVLAIPREAAAIELESSGAAIARDPAIAAALARAEIEHAAAVVPGHGEYLRLTSARPDFDPVAAASALRASGLFRAAIPDYHLRLTIVPNDVSVPLQYSVVSDNGADVHLTEAWDVTRGDTAVVIAIMDTGVDLGHEDLAPQIWTNRREIPGNGVDDDGNGYVDDVHGWDFGDGDDDPDPTPVIDAATGIDLGFHGTFVAGIASAATNNGLGVAGAGWKCRIMPLKVTDSNGDITTSAVTAAFLYAADERPAVLNMSFGGPGAPGVPAYYQALVDRVTSAGVLCVSGAGNSGADSLSYPAACLDVVSVAATDDQGARASFSSWGSTVDIAAPGAAMFSAICENYEIDEFSQVYYLFLFGWDGQTPYMYGDGTSFSSPMVAGVAGLVRARFPALTPEQVANRIIRTGDHVAFDEPIGPKLNAYRAVTEPLAVPIVATPTAVGLECVGPNPFARSARLRYVLPVRGAVRLRIYDCTGRMVSELTSGDAEAGPHEIAWAGTDATGARVASGIYFVRLRTPSGIATAKLVLAH